MKTFRHLDTVTVSACFSDCGRYRYLLTINDSLAKSGRTLGVIMQNPSVADENRADKSVQFLESLFFRKGVPAIGPIKQVHILNQFARIRTKDFQGNRLQIGPENDRYLRWAIAVSDLILLAWGKTNPYLNRKMAIHSLLLSKDIKTLFQTRSHPSRGYYDNFITAYRPEEHLGPQAAF